MASSWDLSGSRRCLALPIAGKMSPHSRDSKAQMSRMELGSSRLLSAIFDVVDKDKNGIITKDEFMVFFRQNIIQFRIFMDETSDDPREQRPDNVLSEAEIAKQADAMFEKLDLDKSMRVSRDEFVTTFEKALEDVILGSHPLKEYFLNDINRVEAAIFAGTVHTLWIQARQFRAGLVDVKEAYRVLENANLFDWTIAMQYLPTHMDYETFFDMVAEVAMHDTPAEHAETIILARQATQARAEM